MCWRPCAVAHWLAKTASTQLPPAEGYEFLPLLIMIKARSAFGEAGVDLHPGDLLEDQLSLALRGLKFRSHFPPLDSAPDIEHHVKSWAKQRGAPQMSELELRLKRMLR